MDIFFLFKNPFLAMNVLFFSYFVIILLKSTIGMLYKILKVILKILLLIQILVCHLDQYLNTFKLKILYFLEGLYIHLKPLDHNEEAIEFQTLWNKSFFRNYIYRKADAVHIIILTFFHRYIDIFMEFNGSKCE